MKWPTVDAEIVEVHLTPDGGRWCKIKLAGSGVIVEVPFEDQQGFIKAVGAGRLTLSIRPARRTD